MWWATRDSNPDGLPHTPLKRARLPVPPAALAAPENSTVPPPRGARRIRHAIESRPSDAWRPLLTSGRRLSAAMPARLTGSNRRTGCFTSLEQMSWWKALDGRRKTFAVLVVAVAIASVAYALI